MRSKLRGRWTDENRAFLESLLAHKHNPPPIAIFDWDNTCVNGDTADMVFHQLCRDLAFRFEAPGFIQWIEELPVPTRILECYEFYRARPSHENRPALRFEFERTRWTLHNSEDDNQAWAWDSGAFVGWKPSEVREYTRRTIARELVQPLRTEWLEFKGGETSDVSSRISRGIGIVRSHLVAPNVDPIPMVRRGASDDASPPLHLEISRGLRLRPEMHELVYEMRHVGWQVYIITASPQWEIEAFAERYFIPSHHVIGMRRSVVNGRIMAQIEPTVSWGDGKLDAYQMFVTRERPPNFATGDSIGDWKLLEW